MISLVVWCTHTHTPPHTPTPLRAVQDKEHSFTLPLSACHQWATSVSWWMYLLRVSRLWSIFNWGLYFRVFVVAHNSSNAGWGQSCLAQYPSSEVKPPHVTFPNSSSLCFRDFLRQRWFLFAYQPPKDFPCLSLFGCPLNPCEVLAAVTSPGKEFPSFLSQLHGELLPHVCFEPAICLLHLMPPALC